MDTETIVKKEISQLSTRIDENTCKINEVKNECEALKSQVVQQSKIIDSLRKKNNIIIHGIIELHEETRDSLFVIIKTLLFDKLGIILEQNVVNQLRRLGEPKDNNNRRILLSLTSGFVKNTIMENRLKLKGTNIYLNNDLDKESQIIYSKYRFHFKELKSNGINVRVRNGTIWLNNKSYSPDAFDSYLADISASEKKCKSNNTERDIQNVSKKTDNYNAAMQKGLKTPKRKREGSSNATIDSGKLKKQQNKPLDSYIIKNIQNVGEATSEEIQ